MPSEPTDRAPESVPGAPIAVEFELTPEEWVEVSIEHGWRSVPLAAARRKVRLLLVAIFALLMLLFVLLDAAFLAVTALFAGGLLVALLDPLLRNAQRSQLRQMASAGLATGTFGRHRVELRPEGMLDSTAGYDWLTRWSAIERVTDTDGAFLVYTGPNACLPIPHSAFRNADSLRRFADAFYRLREGRRKDALK